MLLADNFIHADMHPGNILLRISKATPPEAPTLVLIGALSVLSLLALLVQY
jgi:predicted unusual protein kinase regulating ubiquinone biosynthesis (AarF/ABC1/UbiB family)